MKKLMSKQLTRSLSAVCSCVMVMATVLASADTYMWSTGTTGAAVDGAGTWNTTTANWVGAGDVHTTWNNANGDTAAFGNGGAAGSVTLSSGITIGGLLFNTGITGAYTLAGGPLNLVNAPLFDVHTNATISAVIQGVPGFTKTGSGTLTLSAANTFTGDVVVEAGTLRNTRGVNLAAPVATGLGNMTLTGRQIQVNGGATLLFAENDPIGSATVLQNTSFVVDGGTIDHGTYFVTMPNILLKNGATLKGGNGVNGNYQTFNLMGSVIVEGTSGSTIATTGSSLTGIHLGTGNNSFIVHPTGSDPDLTVSAPLINKPGSLAASGFTKTGLGKMLLSADNSYSGGTTVSNGILQIGNGGATGNVGSGPVKLATAGASLIFNRSGTVNVPGAVSGSGSLQHLGSGVVTLSGGNTYTGTTTVSNGILAISGLLSGYDTPGMITVGPGAGLTVDPLLWNIGALASLLGNASFAPNSLFGAGTLSGDDEIPNSLALPNSMGFVKTGPNVLTLSGNNSYAGGTFVMGGVLHADFGAGISATTNVTLNNGSFSPITGPLTAALGTGAGQVNIVPGTAVGFSAIGTPLTVNLGGAGDTLSWGSSSFNPSIFVLNDFGANTNLTLVNGINLNAARTINVNAATVTIGGTIANGSATAALIKGGAGTLELTAANAYTGGTTLNAGALFLSGGDNRLSTSGAITINSGTFDLGGGTQTTAGTVILANGVLTNGTLSKSGAAYDVRSGTVAATLAGSVGLTKTTDGSLILTGTNTYTGSTYVNGGTLWINGGKISGPGFLDVSRTASFKLSSGSVTAGGQFVVGAHGTSTGEQSDGTLQVNGIFYLGGYGDGPVGTGTYTQNGGTVAVTGNIAFNGGGPHSGIYNLAGGDLTVPYFTRNTGSGQGTFNFNGGVLKPAASSTTFMQGLTAVNVQPGGAIIDTAAFNITIGQPLLHDVALGALADGGLTKLGDGMLTLAVSNTYSGVTSVQQGSLLLPSMGVANLKLHLDASDISTLAQSADGSVAVTTSGDPVGYWGDLSVSDKPATQGTASRRPTYITNVTEFNGMPVVQFDGTDDDITSLLNINATNMPNMTIVMVCRQVTFKLQSGLWGHDDGGWDRLQLLNWDSVVGKNLIAANNGTVAVNGMNTNGVVIYAATLRNGAGNGSAVYINGVADGSSGLPTFTSQEGTGLPSITLANISPGGNYRSHIQIGEVMVFDTALSKSVCQNLERHLRHKWLGASEPLPPPVLPTEEPVRLKGDQLDGLQLRLDASDRSTLAANSDGTGAVTATGDPVGYWGDLSDSDLPATQPVAASRPVYKASVADFNNMPVLEFDGIDDQITSLLDINKANLPNMTIMIVYRKVAAVGKGGVWGHDDGAHDRFQLLDYYAANGDLIATSGNMVNVKGMNNNNVLIYAATLQNGVANGSDVFINGLSDATIGLPDFTSSEGTGQASLTLACIGNNPGGDHYGNIQIGEVLVYNSALSDQKRSGIEEYLRKKWVNGISGRVEVAAGAELNLDGGTHTLTSVSGSGTVTTGTLTVLDAISPAGTAVGTMNIAGVSLNGTLRADVGDLLAFTGDTDLSGLTLQVVDTSLLVQGQLYPLVTCSGNLTGSFAATNLERAWKVAYDRTAGTATIRWIPGGTVIVVQ